MDRQNPNAWLLACGPKLVQAARANPAVYRIFGDQAQALAFLDAARWPQGRRCPKCDSTSTYESDAVRRLPLYRCRACRMQFTTTAGTILHGTHIPLGIWLAALYLIESDPEMNAVRRLRDAVGVSHTAAWKMLKRIQAARRGLSRWRGQE